MHKHCLPSWYYQPPVVYVHTHLQACLMRAHAPYPPEISQGRSHPLCKRFHMLASQQVQSGFGVWRDAAGPRLDPGAVATACRVRSLQYHHCAEISCVYTGHARQLQWSRGLRLNHGTRLCDCPAGWLERGRF